MTDIATAIYSRLSGDATLSALLGGGIYPYTPTQAPSRPYITYQLVNMSERPHAMGGDPQLVIDRYQVDIWADTYSDVIAVDDEVHRLLSRWAGTANGVTVQNVMHTDRRDGYESDTEFFRRSNDYELAWVET